MFVLATVYRPPGHHTDFIKEFADFLSELVLAADKVLIVGDFNIHVDNEKDSLGSAFIDIINSIGVKQPVSGPTHCRNYTIYQCFPQEFFFFLLNAKKNIQKMK